MQFITKFFANNSVTNAKAAQLPANSIKGNNTGSPANGIDLTVAQAQTLLVIPTASSPLPVGSGGTGLTTLTLHNVILGNGTSTPTFVAPGTSGNLLTSNGTTWVSSPPAAATVTFSGFSARLSTNTSTAGQTITYDVATYNTGTQYNTGTGVWTVPTTGYYEVTMMFAYTAQTVATDRFNLFGLFDGTNVLVVGETIIPVMLTSQASGFIGTSVFHLTSGSTYQFIDGANRLTTWAGGVTLTNNGSSPVSYVAVSFLGS